MAAPSFVNRQRDGWTVFVEGFNQIADERGADQWMINQAKKNAVSLRRERTNRGLDRGNLATLPISVDHDFVFRERHSRGDGVRIRSEYHATNADSRTFGNIQQVLQAHAVLIG